MLNDGNAHRSNLFTLPVANIRNVFYPHDVEKKMHILQARNSDQDSLLATYKKMLERGPQRFQMKPSGIPEMKELYLNLPNFTDVLDEVKRSIALSEGTHDGLEITPILLLGKPGIGKTHFAKKIADLIGTGMTLVPMSSTTAGWLLSGASSQWKGAKPGKVFEALVVGEYANPVIVVDEIDKTSQDAQYDPLGALYSLLEHDTARSFTDEFAEVPIDASQVIWISTANDERPIPKPILNRMNVFTVEPPSKEEARRVARNLYRSICGDHGWGEQFESEPSEDVLDHLSHVAPRDMRRALVAGFGNAKLNKRYSVEPKDFPATYCRKNSIGFV